MHWSKYNFLFNSQRFGFFLYNSLSNVFFKLDERHYRLLGKMQDKTLRSDLDMDDKFMKHLRKNKIFVEKGEEKKLLLSRQYLRASRCFDPTRLSLTICPTLGCNFRCPYCIEDTQNNKAVMSAETVNQLIKFVKNFKKAKKLSVAWYGGEPTLAFEVICNIALKLNKLGVSCNKSFLFTNGYLLNKNIIDQLNDLKINALQITLDGFKERHDKYRKLAGREPTYDRIMHNIEMISNSSYKGMCIIRIHVDKNTLPHFLVQRESLMGMFNGKKISVYAAHLENRDGNSSHKSCSFLADDWSDFIIGMYREYGFAPEGGFYPKSRDMTICTANFCNGFIIGPEGELYKCMKDVGKKEMILGSIWREPPVTNIELQSMYSIGTDPHLDVECRACRVLPICRGGCPNMRLRAKYFNEKGLDFCSPYKDNLIKYLEEYYHMFLTKEVCDETLNPGSEVKNSQGYRAIHPSGNENLHLLSLSV